MFNPRRVTHAVLLAAVALAVAAGCRTAERAMLGLGRIKSPVTLSTPGLNRPFTREELAQAGINPADLTPVATGGPRFADLGDLQRKDTIIVVCLSGGGARAARMATHTLALLEREYNQRGPAGGEGVPFVQRVDAWSSISGGSVFASFVAAHLMARPGGHTNSFAELTEAWRARWGVQRLGGAAMIYYVWPGNLGYAPVMQVATEWATLDLFARNLAVLHEPAMRWHPLTRMRELGDLPEHPHFFFNATCRETARPLIFTRSVLHRNLTGDPLTRLAEDPLKRWIGGEPATPAELAEPFRHAATLEDLGSPPHRFPLAYAAMASAAFPGVFEPLALRHYAITTNATAGRPLWWRQSALSVVDGGIYDNTGLVTALQLFDYLHQGRTNGGPRMVILSVDANNEPEGYAGAGAPPRVPWKLDLPLRGALSAVGTIAGVYSSQQRLVLAAIEQRIRTLERTGKLEYYPVRLRDAALLPATATTLPANRLRELKERAEAEARSTIKAVNLFGVVQDIPTDFVLTDDEDRDLKLTVERLLHRVPEGRPSVANGLLRSLDR